MAADIEKELGLTCEFIGGHGGVFDVKLDGELVWSNDVDKCGVPEPDAVIEVLREALDQ